MDKMTFESGDVVIVHTDFYPSKEQEAVIKQKFLEEFPEASRVVVLQQGIDLEFVSASPLETYQSLPKE